MNITLRAEVQGNYRDVMEKFDRELFEALKPPRGKMDIVAFTGSKKGDRVHLRFGSPINSDWISEIVEDNQTDTQAWFIDVGTTLPWPLASWMHKHSVQKVTEQRSIIIDDMTFTGRNWLLTALLYPAIYIGFYPRKKIYEQYFNQQFQ